MATTQIVVGIQALQTMAAYMHLILYRRICKILSQIGIDRSYAD